MQLLFSSANKDNKKREKLSAFQLKIMTSPKSSPKRRGLFSPCRGDKEGSFSLINGLAVWRYRKTV